MFPAYPGDIRRCLMSLLFGHGLILIGIEIGGVCLPWLQTPLLKQTWPSTLAIRASREGCWGTWSVRDEVLFSVSWEKKSSPSCSGLGWNWLFSVTSQALRLLRFQARMTVPSAENTVSWFFFFLIWTKCLQIYIIKIPVSFRSQQWVINIVTCQLGNTLGRGYQSPAVLFWATSPGQSGLIESPPPHRKWMKRTGNGASPACHALRKAVWLRQSRARSEPQPCVEDGSLTA